MLEKAHDIFALVITFLRVDWQPKLFFKNLLFTLKAIKDCPYNYGKIIQVL
jgi:hypothetical protein